MPACAQTLRLRPQKKVKTKAITDKKNKICAIQVAVPAMPANPKIAAMIPGTKKNIAQTQPCIFRLLYSI